MDGFAPCAQLSCIDESSWSLQSRCQGDKQCLLMQASSHGKAQVAASVACSALRLPYAAHGSFTVKEAVPW